jgi:uncharacterized protein YutE (UPF0331/DUF86 family)
VTDTDLVKKRLAFIETCQQELRRDARPERLESDVRERRFVEHTLQLAIQAALDVASHIASDSRLGEPTSNRALFDLLVSSGWLPAELGDVLGDMAGFRNILVHGYVDVRVDVVHDVLVHHLEDLTAFIEAIRSRL